MANKKAEFLIRVYARVKKERPTTLIKKFDNLPNSAEKNKMLKSMRDELLKYKAEKLKGKTQKDLEIDAKKWYQNMLKQAKGAGVTRLQVGYFYHFTYKSDYYPDQLSYYDTKPLIYLFDVSKSKGITYLLGINFHWTTKKIRIMLLNKMIKAYPSQFDNDKPLQLRYDGLKNGFRKGYIIIRKYIRNNVKKKILRIPNIEMINIVNLRSEKFTGISPERAVQVSKSKEQYRKDILSKESIARQMRIIKGRFEREGRTYTAQDINRELMKWRKRERKKAFKKY